MPRRGAAAGRRFVPSCVSARAHRRPLLCEGAPFLQFVMPLLRNALLALLSRLRAMNALSLPLRRRYA